MRVPKSCATLLAIVSLASCAAEEVGPERDPAIPVVAQPLVTMPETAEIEAIGSARAVVAAELYPESAGLVNAVRFGAGDYVRRGEALVELDARRERLAVELAQVAVAEAEQLLGRYRRIEDTGALSASQIEAGVTALESAKIELEQARVAFADRTVRAPFSGHMGIPQVDRGDRITPTTLIATIDDRSRLFVDFAAPESIFAELRPGSVVRLTPYADPSRTIEARVEAVGSAVAADTRSFTVRTVVPNPEDRLRPGMSFRARFSSPGRVRPAVPEAAIVWGGDGSYVWTVRDGVARRVPATIVAREDGRVLIDAELRRDDRVIVQGVQRVRDGQPVRLVQPRRPAPAKVQVEPPAVGKSPDNAADTR